MDQHHLDAHQAEQGDVGGYGVPQLLVHGHAAAVDHDDLAVVALDVGQGLGENGGPIQMGIGHSVYLLVRCGKAGHRGIPAVSSKPSIRFKF